MKQKTIRSVRSVLSVLLLASAASAADLDEFKIKREAVFEFAQKPAVTRNGDNVTIAFETKGLCDVTVAIENADGRIIRHLVSGVLGPKAPEPFQKNSKKQTVVWDGKNDQDVYVDDKDSCTVRVSLGLKPQFERTLFWSPHKRIGSNNPIIAAAPEGVYVFEGCGVDSLRLYDHEGNYVRTIYPFPANKLKDVQGLDWREFPQDGQKFPLKQGNRKAYSTLFTMGTPKGQAGGQGGVALAVQGSRIALPWYGLGRVATDGSSGGLNLGAPEAGLILDAAGKLPMAYGPRRAAFSPDGRWLYLTGYPGLHGVARLDYATAGKAELFAGSLKPGDAGADNAHFNTPLSIACDSQGCVYVADHMNDRIQVFTPDGKFHKSIPAVRPVDIGVHPRTREIYVGSWSLGWSEPFTPPQTTIEAVLTRLGTLDAPNVLATYPLPLNLYRHNRLQIGEHYDGSVYRMEFDLHTDPPTAWLIPGPSAETDYYGWGRVKQDAKAIGLALLQGKDGQLVAKRDFWRDAMAEVTRAKPTNSGGGAGPRQRLYVNPKDGRLYVGEADCGDSKAFNQLVEIDPNTGKAKLMDLPMATEDLAIDLNGFFYLRSDLEVGRFDPVSWREIPWDYGEDRAGAGFGSAGARLCRLMSGLVLPAEGRPSWWHMGGMAVSPKGHLAVTCHNPVRPVATGPSGQPLSPEKANYGSRRGKAGKYTPRLYPGRAVGWETHVWDEHGKVVVEDATPGIGVTDGIGLDKDDNLYVMSSGNRTLDGKPYFLPYAETYMKAKAGKMKAITAGDGPPVKAEAGALPKRPADMGGVWIEGAEWLYGGVGFSPWGGCICWNTRPALDLFSRSFLAEIDHYSVAVLDTAGNLILRIGKYGNVDDGKPLILDGGPKNPRSIGGDEVALFYAPYLATHSDRRLFIADLGNFRILSVKLGYHAEEKIALKDVADAEKK